jgi:hypothetical protein
MEHLLEKGEFFVNKHIRGVPDEGETWQVCEDYEVRNTAGDVRLNYLHPRYSQYQKDKWSEYMPLQDTPDLFLRFAKLYEQEPSEQAALNWVKQYGLLGYIPDDDSLGYTPDGSRIYGRPKRETLSWEEIRPQSAYLGYGVGDEQFLGVFWEEVRRAAGILAMYEAWLSRDNARAKEVLLESSPFIGGRLWGYVDKWPDNTRVTEVEVVDGVVNNVLEGSYVRYCLPTATYIVSGTVNDFCYHRISTGSNWEDSTQVVDVWAFDNLLGAMYLQMYWLMGSAGNATRCRWCGRLVSLESPYPGAKKSPSHKRYCDAYCRQKWNYHDGTGKSSKGERKKERERLRGTS